MQPCFSSRAYRIVCESNLLSEAIAKKKTETTFRKILLIIGAGGSEEKIRVIPTGSRTYGSRPSKVLFSPFSNIINSEAMRGVQHDSGDRNRLDRSEL